jgi:hypothetical protein
MCRGKREDIVWHPRQSKNLFVEHVKSISFSRVRLCQVERNRSALPTPTMNIRQKECILVNLKDPLGEFLRRSLMLGC